MNNQSITIEIQYANGEKYDVHSPGVIRALIEAVKDNLEAEYKNKTAKIDNIYSTEASAIVLLKAIEDFESTL